MNLKPLMDEFVFLYSRLTHEWDDNWDTRYLEVLRKMRIVQTTPINDQPLRFRKLEQQAMSLFTKRLLAFQDKESIT
jgi:hypothetical protein